MTWEEMPQETMDKLWMIGKRVNEYYLYVYKFVDEEYQSRHPHSTTFFAHNRNEALQYAKDILAKSGFVMMEGEKLDVTEIIGWRKVAKAYYEVCEHRDEYYEYSSCAYDNNSILNNNEY